MAQLNLKERVLEAKIAYLGPRLSGRTTNLHQLTERVESTERGSLERDGGAMSLSVRPQSVGKVNGCEVRFHLSASPRGDDVLGDVDGIVLVVPSQPEEIAEARAALAAVRATLAQGKRPHRVPIVLQLNKRDLPSAMEVDAILDAMDAVGLPHVEATAAIGAGVVETFGRAVDEVLVALREPRGQGARSVPPAPASHVPAPAPASVPPAPRTEAPREDTMLRAWMELTLQSWMEQTVARTREAVRDDLARFDVTSLSQQIARALQAQREHFDAALAALRAESAEAKAPAEAFDPSPILAELDGLRDAIAQASRADGERLGAELTTMREQVRKSIDPIAQEVRSARAFVTQMEKRAMHLGVDLSRLIEQQDATAKSLADVQSRLSVLGERVARLATRDGLRELGTAVTESDTSITEALSKILEDVKGSREVLAKVEEANRKKSWWGG